MTGHVDMNRVTWTAFGNCWPTRPRPKSLTSRLIFWNVNRSNLVINDIGVQEIPKMLNSTKIFKPKSKFWIKNLDRKFGSKFHSVENEIS